MENNQNAETSIVETLKTDLRGVMEVSRIQTDRGGDQVIAFYGDLYQDPETAFEAITERFEPRGYTAMLAEGEKEKYQVVAMRGIVRPKAERRWVNLLLFVATIFSTMLTGFLGSTDMTISSPLDYLRGLPFAAAMLAILGAHELAHYFVARRYGSPVSLPYFVPMPAVSAFGTMGAVIFQRAPMRDRKALFDIGIAGPLAGLVVALPLLIIGLVFSQVGRPSDFMEISESVTVTQEGNSLVYLAAKYLVFGRLLPDESGQDVWLSLPDSPGGPVAFAAWAGLLVTAINLLPVGQLDGGHVAYALLGRWAWKLAYVVIGLLGTLAVYLVLIGSPAAATWGIWAGLLLLMRPQHPPPLNDVTPLDRRRKWMGVVLTVIFVLIFVPIPLIPSG